MAFKGNKIFANASWIIVGRIVQAVLTFFITIFTVRFFGPSNYGLISYASSLTSFVLPIVQLGLTAVLVYELVNNPKDEGKIIGSAITLSVISAALSMLGIAVFCAIANYGEKDTLIVCSLYSISLLFQATELIIYWFQYKYLSKYTAVVMFIAYIAMTAYRVFLLATGKSVYWFSVAQSFDFAIVSILLLIIYKRKGGQRLRFSLTVTKRLLSRSKYYILTGIMGTVFAQTGRIALKLIDGNEQTGYYSVAFACAGFLGFVFSAIIDAFRPTILAKKKKTQAEYESAVIGLYAVIIQSAILITLGVFVFAKLVIVILYGSDYVQAVPILRIMIWCFALAYFTSAQDVWILAEEKQKYLLVSNGTGAIVNIALNVVLIPIFGGIGAAFALLLTRIFTSIVMSIVIKPLRRNIYLFYKALNPMVLYKLVKQNLR